MAEPEQPLCDARLAHQEVDPAAASLAQCGATRLVLRRRSEPGAWGAVLVLPSPDDTSKFSRLHVLMATLDNALRSRWRRFRTQYALVSASADEECVHEVRTTSRRLLAVLQLICEVDQRKLYRQMRRTVRAVVKHLGRLRDAHVERQTVKAVYGDDHGLAKEYIARLDQEIEALERRKLASVPRVDFKLCRRAVRRFSKASKKSAARADAKQRERRLPNRAAILLAQRRFVAFDKTRSRSLAERSPEALHRSRLAFKKFRYTMEMLARIIPGVDDAYMAHLKRAQSAMGEVQDLAVLRDNLRAFIERDGAAADPAETLAPVEAALEEQLDESLALIGVIERPWSAAN